MTIAELQATLPDGHTCKKPYKSPRTKETKASQAAANFYSNVTPPATKQETHFRHSWWQPKREKVRAALIKTCVNVFNLNRFDECGSECTVEYSPTLKKHRVRANYCRSRHCEACMKAKANKIAHNLRRRLAENKKKQYRFITLTLKHSNEPLNDQIRRLYACFKKLRKSKCWSESQNGGAATLETGWNAKTRQWHPHLHVISEGYFLYKENLQNAWHHATGDSFIADIRELKNEKDAAYYVSKYVAKGTSAIVWDDIDASAEWITATRGVRTCATYGTWRGYKLLQNPEPTADWAPVGKLTTIISDANAGQPYAQAILLSLRPPGNTDGPNQKRAKPS